MCECASSCFLTNPIRSSCLVGHITSTHLRPTAISSEARRRPAGSFPRDTCYHDEREGGRKTSRFHRRSSRSDTPSDSSSFRTDTRSGAAQLALVFEALPPFDLSRATRVLVRSARRLQPARGTADGTVITTCAILQLLSPRSAALTVSPSCSPASRQRLPVRVGRTRPAPGLTQSHDLFRHQSNFF